MIPVGRPIVSVGIDAVEVARIRTATSRARFVDRVFTPNEVTYCQRKQDPAERFAARFAAKEAALKALGVGLGAVDFVDIEIDLEPSGAPTLRVGGRGAELADELGISGWLVSMTHTATVANAIVIGTA